MSQDIFVARQPIFDRALRVVGYELLYRNGAENAFGDSAPTADVASAENLDRTLLGFGLERLTAGRDAYVNASRRILVNEIYSLLPPGRTVLELLETVPPDPEVVAACRRLKEQGYRLALDDFVHTPAHEPLLELADIVKIDFRTHGEPARTSFVKRWGHGRMLLAEKVETEEDWKLASDAGYTYFQGYFFARPQMLRSRDIAPNKVTYLRLLRELHASTPDLDAIEAVIGQDVAMSVKLLRYLNSAGFGWSHEVTSIRQAIRVLGERPLRKWASLVAVVGLSVGKPQELIVVALTRARFAEQLGTVMGLAHLELELFLAGLLSTVDALTDRPLVEALAPLAVAPSIREALLEGAPPLGDALRIVIGFERGRWSVVEKLCAQYGAGEEEVARMYGEAVLWAEDHAQP
jgi:EAL and modified HD-GYP domain-containing signal transduction protein